jgi:signal peptidase II
VLSGAIGNLVDRIFLGYVRDFISIRLFNFIFNIADIFVTVGMILFMIYLVISMIKESKEKKNVVDK